MQNEAPAPMRPSGPHYGAIWHPRERSLAVFLHLSALAAPLSLPFIYGFGAALGPLIIWLIFRRKSDMVDFQGKKALNYQLSMSAYWLGALLLGSALFVASGRVAIGIGENPDLQGADGLASQLLFLSAWAVMLTFVAVWPIWTIRAAVRASRGDPPEYILAIPFLR